MVRWDEKRLDELKTLIDNDYSDVECGEYFNRSPEAIQHIRLEKLGIRRKPRRNYWKPKEDKILRETLHLRAEDVAKKLKRSRHSVIDRRKKLGLKSTFFRRWQPWQLQILYEVYPTQGAWRVAKLTGKTHCDVWTKASTEGIAREKTNDTTI